MTVRVVIRNKGRCQYGQVCGYYLSEFVLDVFTEDTNGQEGLLTHR